MCKPKVSAVSFSLSLYILFTKALSLILELANCLYHCPSSSGDLSVSAILLLAILGLQKQSTTPSSFCWCWRSQLQGPCLLGRHSTGIRGSRPLKNLFILIYCNARFAISFILDLESPWKRVSGCVYESFQTEQGRATLRMGVAI